MSKIALSKEDIQDLEAGVKKYRKAARVADPNAVGLWGDDCGLCRRYHKYGVCVGCPIKDTTGEHDCEGTPYLAVYPGMEKEVSNVEPGEELGLGFVGLRFADLPEALQKQFRSQCRKMAKFLQYIIKNNE